MRLLVTGASGFIGKNLLLAAPKGWEITGTHLPKEDFAAFLEKNALDNVHAVECDLTKEAHVARLEKEYDACVHLAANSDPQKSFAEPAFDLQVNAGGTLNLLSHSKFGKFVFMSSGAVYDGLQGKVGPACRLDPKLPYAISKMAAEQYVKFYRQAGSIGGYTILRFFGAYGPYEPERKIYTKLVRAFALDKRHEFSVYGDGMNLIDAMYVCDAVDGILKVLKSAKGDMTADFCSGTPISIDGLVHAAAGAFGIAGVKITHSGVSREPIGFHASPEAFEKAFAFKPAVGLTQGFSLLAEHIVKGGQRQ